MFGEKVWPGRNVQKTGVCVTKTREIFFGKRCSIAAKTENEPEKTLSWMHNRKKSDGNRDKNYGNKDSFSLLIPVNA